MDRPAGAPAAVDTDWAFARYEAVRGRLVHADFPPSSEPVADVAAVADRFDAFVLDAFGVLNVGETAVPGAVARIAQLRAAGKRLVVLTNGATQSRAEALAKYRKLGFDFTAEEVVASRDLAAAALRGRGGLIWAAAGAGGEPRHRRPARGPLLAGAGAFRPSAAGRGRGGARVLRQALRQRL